MNWSRQAAAELWRDSVSRFARSRPQCPSCENNDDDDDDDDDNDDDDNNENDDSHNNNKKVSQNVLQTSEEDQSTCV